MSRHRVRQNDTHNDVRLSESHGLLVDFLALFYRRAALWPENWTTMVLRLLSQSRRYVVKPGIDRCTAVLISSVCEIQESQEQIGV